MSTTGEQIHWGEIDGVSIDFPLDVEEMNSLTLTWSVPLEAASKLIPGDGFEVADMGGGTAMLVIAVVDYRRNPWGDYDEVNLGLLAHPTGRPEEVGAFQWRMPVNQTMTCEAGNKVLGLPKTVEELAFSYTEDRVSVELVMDGEPTLSASWPRVAPAGAPVEETTLTYSYLDGVATIVPLTIELPTGILDPAEVVLELGHSPAAEELRGLGLPRAPELAMWGEGLAGHFDPPRAV